MPLEKIEAPRTRRLSTRPHDRRVSFHFADEISDEPGSLHAEVSVQGHRPGDEPFRATRAIASSALTADEQRQLGELLGKLIDAELAGAGYAEPKR
jgi:hypothetical protein